MKYNTTEEVELRQDVIENIGYADYEHEMFELSITVSTLDSKFNRNQVLVEQLLHNRPLNYVDVLQIVSSLHNAVAIEVDSEECVRLKELLVEIRDSIEDLMTHTDSLGLEIDEEGNIENRLPRETQLTDYNNLVS